MRKASSVMKKTLIPGGSAPGKPSMPHSTTATNSNENDINESRRTTKDTDLSASHDSTAGMSISSNDIGLDVPILPSTSTFSLAGKDDKGEKLKKKAKTFLDERQKIKSRAQSLWSYIGKWILFYIYYYFFL